MNSLTSLLIAFGFLASFASAGFIITLAQVQKALPYNEGNAAKYFVNLGQAMKEGKLNTCPRVSAFIAQIGHESGDLRWMEELADGSQYEGELDKGNTQPGDGVKYKGRGPIQVTGRYNYGLITTYFNHDFINNPTDAALPQWGFRIALWYWNTHNLTPLADLNTQSGFDQITYLINGGYNGKADRDSHYAAAKQIWGC